MPDVTASAVTGLPEIEAGADLVELIEATGDKRLPAMKLPDGTVLKNSRAILGWVREQRTAAA